MRLVIVTGMSGAGKSTVMRMLEDIGFSCVDNLPVSLLEVFIKWTQREQETVSKAALGIDIRNGQGLEELTETIEKLQQEGHSFEILYMDASTEVLVKRYQETRRTHPLSGNNRVDHGIEEERARMRFLRERADYIIDSSQLLVRDLKAQIDTIFVKHGTYNNIFLTVLSFGFKYGIPSDADLVFDVRFLSNPFYVPQLKHKTGNDKAVNDYVMSFPEATLFLDKIEDLITFLVPRYIAEGKNQLVIGIGCTGGKHRSVTLANQLGKRLSKTDYGSKTEHRDIDKH